MARIAGKVSEVKYARADRRHTDRDGAHLRNARRAYSRAERREGRKACREGGATIVRWGVVQLVHDPRYLG